MITNSKLWLFLILFSCGIIPTASAQWISLKTDTTIDYWDMYFHSADEGILIGNNEEPVSQNKGIRGILERTTDGGFSWESTQIKYPTTDSGPFLFSIDFVTDSVGYAGATDGNIYKTENGGKDWKHFVWHGWDDIRQMCAVNDSVLYVKTSSGRVSVLDVNDSNAISRRSIDLRMNSFALLTDSSGFASSVSHLPDSGFIYRFDNYGLTYQRVFSTSKEIMSLNLTDSLHGYAVGVDGLFTKTIDGGKTWSNAIFMGQGTLFDIHFVNDTLGFAVGGCYDQWATFPCPGFLYKTIDRGTTWTLEFKAPRSLKSIAFPSNSIGYIAGHLGQLYKTTTMGLWVEDAKGQHFEQASLFPNPNQGSFKLQLSTKAMAHIDDIRVYNSLGQELAHTVYPEHGYVRISLKNERLGICFVQVNNNCIKFSVQ